MKLAMSGNPTVLETLWAPTIVDTNEYGLELRGIRNSFLSRRVISSYAGYARQQARRLENKFLMTGTMNYQMQKHLSHMIRLMLAGIHVVNTGEIMVEVPVEHREFILGVKRGLISRQRALEFFDVLSKKFDEDVHFNSVLPDKPDFDTVNNLLLDIRRTYWQ